MTSATNFHRTVVGNTTLNGRSYRATCDYCNTDHYFKSRGAAESRTDYHRYQLGCSGYTRVAFLTVAQVSALLAEVTA